VIDGLTVTFAGILQAGAGGIVTVIVYMILTGKLVSARTHTERVNDAKEQAATWKSAYETSEQARRENESLAREGLEASRMVLHLVRSIRGVVTDEDEGSVGSTYAT